MEFTNILFQAANSSTSPPIKISKSTKIISHCRKIEPKKLLEPMTVNVFNLKKIKKDVELN